MAIVISLMRTTKTANNVLCQRLDKFTLQERENLYATHITTSCHNLASIANKCNRITHRTFDSVS